MKNKLLFPFLIPVLFGLFNTSSIQAQYFTKNNWETQLGPFTTINGQWATSNPTNNTLGAYHYQGINFGYDINNYSSLVNPIGTDDLYFGRWCGNWKGWRKIVIANENGNVGIGTTTPTYKLDVAGSITLGSQSVNANTTKLFLKNPAGKIWALSSGANMISENNFSIYNWTDSAATPLFSILDNGKVGIGTIAPIRKLEVASDGTNWISGTFSGTGNIDKVVIGNLVTPTIGGHNSALNAWSDFTIAGQNIMFSPSGTEKVRITNSGNVGIGSKNPDQKLTVKGKIHAEEIIVDLAVPADYVFQKYYTGKSELKSDYSMPTLGEIENFTKKNHHLPNVPSAQEVQQNGVSLGEMSNVLLQKVEELTLYAIEQNKKLMLQQEELERLKKENENYKSLAERLSSIEKVLKK